LGTGHSKRVRDFADKVADVVERRVGRRPIVEAPPPVDPAPEAYRVNVDRLAARGLRATTPIESSIDETVAFCLHYEERA
jgi:nucleoside-diphosphate-sugar epimerase